MSRRASSASSCSKLEEKVDDHDAPSRHHGDYSEKKQKRSTSLARISTRGSNVQAVPGVPLDEADFIDGSEGSDEDGHGPDVTESARGGLEAVASRASSFNPGPPPDGGARAWFVGESLNHCSQ